MDSILGFDLSYLRSVNSSYFPQESSDFGEFSVILFIRLVKDPIFRSWVVGFLEGF